MGRPKHHHAALALPVVARKHSLLAPLVANVFDTLGVGVTLLDAHDWHRIHDVPHVLTFEAEEGVEAHRVAYNDRCMKELMKKRRPVLGQYAGFWDLFIPVFDGNDIRQILVTGPFGRGSLSSTDMTDRWRRLTGRHGHLADPQFSHYVSVTLGTVVFDEKRLRAYRRFMTCFADLMASRGDAEALMAETNELQGEVLEARFAERMWEISRAMVDPRTARTWASPFQIPTLAGFGISRYPEQAIVGLIAGRQDESDPVDGLIRRHQFQRACVALARSRGDIACGRVGDHGVMFLCAPERSDARLRTRLAEIGERAAHLARRQFALKLHVGIGPTSGASSLPVRYQAALVAAERALSAGTALVHGTDVERPSYALRDLRRQLAELVRERPGNLSARFDRYLEVVGSQSGYRIEAVRAHLEAGLERLAEPFLASGALDEKSFDDMYGSLERATEGADTISELFAAYRRVVADMEEALQQPVEAHQERSLRRAVAFIRDHVSEPLNLTLVARHAGFAPNYFSRLFKRREKVTFERYVQDLRIARAKEMLARTTLSIERVGQLSGFASKHYFHRVFKRVSGETPLACRTRLKGELQADLSPTSALPPPRRMPGARTR